MARVQKVTVNLPEFKNQIGRNRVSKTLVRSIVQPKINETKERLLEEFEDSLITQEIEDGPYAENISGTLSGYGNLYSFLGFEGGKNPINRVRRIFSQPSKIQKVQHIKGSTFLISISVPDKGRILDETPLDWLSGRSWIDAIEHGLAGFAFYLYDENGKFAKWSRSGSAIQSKRGKIRKGALRGSPYISQMLNNFLRSLKNLKF